MGSKHEQDVPTLGFEVLDHMRLIKDHVIPRLALEDMRVPAGKCVGSYTYVEMVLVIPTLAELLASFGRPMVTKNPESGQKLLELHFPVQKNAGRDDLKCMSTPSLNAYNRAHNKMRSPNAAIASEMRKKCDGLDSFPGDNASIDDKM